MTLPTRPLGTSGLEITTVGLGDLGDRRRRLALRLGTPGRRPVARHHAARRGTGITWFDTAGVYGHGHSEEVCARFLREVRDDRRPLVFTKCGPIWDERAPFKEEPSDLSPGNIRRQCDDSLRRLGVERLDLLQFHWPDDGELPIEESWAEMARLVAEGKVRSAGVSNFDTGCSPAARPSATWTRCSRSSR